MKRLLILLLAAVSAACAPRTQTSSLPGGAAGTDSLTGTLRVVGSAPMNVRLVLEGSDGSTTVGGAIEPELRRLAGAEVVLHGRTEAGAFVATDYRISSIDGRPVTLGTVEAITGEYVQLRTPEGELVYLVGATGELRVGQKVWGQVPRGLVVQSFGTVRQ